jgi:NADH:ubiquinone oxidoreductase subunit K
VSQPPSYPYPQTPWAGAVAQPARNGQTPHVEPVAGTDFGLAYAALPPVTSGQAVGALVSGIASVLVTLVTICLGLVGAGDGWGALVAGAFAILATLLGAAAISVGLATMRAIRVAAGAISGRGIAKAGMICGIVGVSLAILGFAGSLIATLA